MTIDLRIVGRFIAGEITVGKESDDEQDDDGNHDSDAEAGTLRARRTRVIVLLGRRQRLRWDFPDCRQPNSRPKKADSVLSFAPYAIDCLSDIA